MSSMYFCSFATVSPCEMCGPLMTKYEPSSAKNVRVKFGLIFFCGFEEEYFFYLLILLLFSTGKWHVSLCHKKS